MGCEICAQRDTGARAARPSPYGGRAESSQSSAPNEDGPPGPPGWELAALCLTKLSSNNQDIKLSAPAPQSHTCVTSRQGG